MQTIPHFIGGKTHSGPDASGGRTLPVFNPATGTKSKEVLCGDRQVVAEAVAAAAEAFTSWRNVSISQ
ncbi:MAG: aldehyde dehydrogenase family protein, partial [Acidimicrobiales bacterium]